MKIKSKFGPAQKEYEIGDIVYLAKDNPLILDNGVGISNFPLAYKTYGQLNEDKSNAILICHALTGDQYAASPNPVTQKDGWWNFMIGPNKPFDTNKFFVICSNVIGGCMGSFGPKEIDPQVYKPYGTNFPMITIQDMVKAQNLLIEHLGIEKLHAVIGGSVGGMQALSWSILYPKKVNLVMPIATSYRHSPQNIAFHEVGRKAIMSDIDWVDGHYLAGSRYPVNGLKVARMTAHITYLSENALHKKFGRNLKHENKALSGFNKEFEVENYLHYQGEKFIERFDPNSYLYITRAADYFDLEKDFGTGLRSAFGEFNNKSKGKFCIIAFSDDWLFPPSEAKKLTQALISCGIEVSFVIIESTSGHDSFLIKNEAFEQTVRAFL